MGMRIKQGKEEFMRRIAVVAIALAVSGLTVPAQASGVGSTGAIPEFNGNGGGIDARQIREIERLFRKGRASMPGRSARLSVFSVKAARRFDATLHARSVSFTRT